MKPLSEPSQGRENAYLGWSDNQLFRRPPIPSAASGLKWVRAIGLGATDAVIPAIQTDVTTSACDFNIFGGKTNAPATFSMVQCAAPLDAYYGIQMTEDYYYYMNAGINATTPEGDMPGPAADYRGAMGVGYTQSTFDSLFSVQDELSPNMGQPYWPGTDFVSGFFSLNNDATWTNWLTTVFKWDSAATPGPLLGSFATNTGVSFDYNLTVIIIQLAAVADVTGI